MVQFNGEPFLEFSFRAHNCITELLDDISDTSYVNGDSDIGRAIEKSMKFAYTKTRVILTFQFCITFMTIHLGRPSRRFERDYFDYGWSVGRKCSSAC